MSKRGVRTRTAGAPREAWQLVGHIRGAARKGSVKVEEAPVGAGGCTERTASPTFLVDSTVGPRIPPNPVPGPLF